MTYKKSIKVNFQDIQGQKTSKNPSINENSDLSRGEHSKTLLAGVCALLMLDATVFIATM